MLKIFQYKLHQPSADSSGNFKALDITIHIRRITLIYNYIYRPNIDNPDFVSAYNSLY